MGGVQKLKLGSFCCSQPICFVLTCPDVPLNQAVDLVCRPCASLPSSQSALQTLLSERRNRNDKKIGERLLEEVVPSVEVAEKVGAGRGRWRGKE